MRTSRQLSAVSVSVCGGCGSVGQLQPQLQCWQCWLRQLSGSAQRRQWHSGVGGGGG